MASGELDPFEPPNSDPRDEVDGREVVERAMQSVEDEAQINMLTVVSGKLVRVMTDSEVKGNSKDRVLAILVDPKDYKAAIGCLGSKVMLIGEPWSDT